MELATKEVRRSPHGSRASPQQAVERGRAGGWRTPGRAGQARPQRRDRHRQRVGGASATPTAGAVMHVPSPSNPDQSTRLSAPTLPDSSLASRKAHAPQASTPTALTLARTVSCPRHPREGGPAATRYLPDSPGPRPRPLRPHAVAQSAPPGRPGQSGPGRPHLPGWQTGAWQAGAHRSSPRPQPGRWWWWRAASAVAGRPRGARRAGWRCHGARATRGARGADGSGARGGGARARAAGLRRRGRRTIASPCRRPPAPAGGPGPSGACGPAGLGAGPESPPPRPAPWQPRPLSVLPAALGPRVSDLPLSERNGCSAALPAPGPHRSLCGRPP